MQAVAAVFLDISLYVSQPRGILVAQRYARRACLALRALTTCLCSVVRGPDLSVVLLAHL